MRRKALDVALFCSLLLFICALVAEPTARAACDNKCRERKCYMENLSGTVKCYVFDKQDCTICTQVGNLCNPLKGDDTSLSCQLKQYSGNATTEYLNCTPQCSLLGAAKVEGAPGMSQGLSLTIDLYTCQ